MRVTCRVTQPFGQWARGRCDWPPHLQKEPDAIMREAETRVRVTWLTAGIEDLFSPSIHPSKPYSTHSQSPRVTLAVHCGDFNRSLQIIHTGIPSTTISLFPPLLPSFLLKFISSQEIDTTFFHPAIHAHRERKSTDELDSWFCAHFDWGGRERTDESRV